MLIETDAKRFIYKAIELEQQVRSYESTEKYNGGVVMRCPAYYKARKQLVEVINQINSVANSEGIGRDDLTVDILSTAEEMQWKIPGKNSKAITTLALQIKGTFKSLCKVINKYSECVDAVDPQLRNNVDLVQALVAYETSWSKGKSFLLNRSTLNSLISFSKLIEELIDKHENIKEKIDSMDADIFIMLPSIGVLKMLENNDKSFNNFFNSDTQFTELLVNLKKRYASEREARHKELYRLIEGVLLEMDEVSTSKEVVGLVNDIKKLAIMLQRSKPTDWNLFMETAIGIM
jgi:hypothetical protein